jgi:lipopolysaccharide transport system ATP-binding protein
MTKKEISSKLDEIVSFSGCERYIDTPVKRYSSGMKVRLAFAVAAHLEPDILIVDEVLAVGDAEFQKKAIGKMQDISGTDGRTVLFVSHNMGAVRSLCNKGVLLKDGKIVCFDKMEKVLDEYEKVNVKTILRNTNGFFEFDKKYGIQSVKTFCDSKQTRIITTGTTFTLEFTFNVKNDFFAPELGIGIANNKRKSFMRFNNIHIGDQIKIKKGIGKINIVIQNFPIYKSGEYYLNLYLGDTDTSKYEVVEDALSIIVEKSNIFNSNRMLEEEHNILAIKDVKYVQIQ